MALTNAPAYIATPPPPPRPYGIFDVAMGPMPFPESGSVGSGTLYVPDTCQDDVFLYDLRCPSVTGSKTFSAIETPVSGAPFAVIVSYTCGSIGFSFDEIRQKLLTRMQIHSQRGVERRIWQGQPNGPLGGIPGLFQSATTLTAAACVTEAVEVLEQTLADNGVVGGMIHARPGMAAHLAQSHLIEAGARNRIETALHTPFVFGQGYNGTGPQGQATTGSTEYMYASGRILIWEDSETFIPPVGETLDRVTNQIYSTAEKIYAVAIECGVWAIEVTRTCTTAGA